MLPLGATLMPGSVTLAPGMATGVMNGPDAPALVVASPPSGDAASATRAATAAFRRHGDLMPRERGSPQNLAEEFLYVRPNRTARTELGSTAAARHVPPASSER